MRCFQRFKPNAQEALTKSNETFLRNLFFELFSLELLEFVMIWFKFHLKARI